jgi:hypothetical protein
MQLKLYTNHLRAETIRGTFSALAVISRFLGRAEREKDACSKSWLKSARDRG